MSKYLEGENCDHIYSSPLERCIHTITPLSDKIGKKINIDERITENRVNHMQDRKWSEISTEEMDSLHSLE